MVDPRHPDILKIGYTVDTVQRIKSISASTPVDYRYVAILGSKDYEYLENCLHRHFEKYRQKREFFNLTKEEFFKGIEEIRASSLKCQFDVLDPKGNYTQRKPRVLASNVKLL